MTRATLQSLSQTADEWLALSTRLRERPVTIESVAGRPGRSDIVVRIRIPKRAWARRPPNARVGSRRGLRDRMYSWLCQ